MSFKEFKEDLLIALVIEADANPTKRIDPLTAAKARGLSFREGWLRQAVSALNDTGLVKAHFFLGGGENGGMAVHLTGFGIKEAEDIASRNGWDLYEDLDKSVSQQAPAEGPADLAPASDRIVTIEHNSRQYREIQEQLDATISAAQKAIPYVILIQKPLHSASPSYKLERS